MRTRRGGWPKKLLYTQLNYVQSGSFRSDDDVDEADQSRDSLDLMGPRDADIPGDTIRLASGSLD